MGDSVIQFIVFIDWLNQIQVRPDVVRIETNSVLENRLGFFFMMWGLHLLCMSSLLMFSLSIFMFLNYQAEILNFKIFRKVVFKGDLVNKLAVDRDIRDTNRQYEWVLQKISNYFTYIYELNCVLDVEGHVGIELILFELLLGYHSPWQVNNMVFWLHLRIVKLRKCLDVSVQLLHEP